MSDFLYIFKKYSQFGLNQNNSVGTWIQEKIIWHFFNGKETSCWNLKLEEINHLLAWQVIFIISGETGRQAADSSSVCCRERVNVIVPWGRADRPAVYIVIIKYYLLSCFVQHISHRLDRWEAAGLTPTDSGGRAQIIKLLAQRLHKDMKQVDNRLHAH